MLGIKNKSSAVIANPTLLIAAQLVVGAVCVISQAVSLIYNGLPTVNAGNAALLILP